MILVAGGTGTLGRDVVTRLRSSGHGVRVLTRSEVGAEGLDAEVVIGEVREPSTLSAAVRGCSAVISAIHGFVGGRGAGPREVDDEGNGHLVQAAVGAGVRHFVLMSVLDARPDHPMSLHRAKYAAEQHLRRSDLSWTVLRPSAYVETWVRIVGAKVGSGGPALVFGRADNPINFVSAQDVAALVERATTDPALRNRAVDVPGPDNLTMTELAGLLGATDVKHVPRTALRMLSAALPPFAPAFARQAHAAVVMDTTDMTADATAVRDAFPDITWHHAAEIARQFRATSEA